MYILLLLLLFRGESEEEIEFMRVFLHHFFFIYLVYSRWSHDYDAEDYYFLIIL
jgi:hypothetical protein